jgi:hypothetical protein
VIDRGLDALDKELCMRQAAVSFERRLVLPARVDIEQSGIAGSTKTRERSGSRAPRAWERGHRPPPPPARPRSQSAHETARR